MTAATQRNGIFEVRFRLLRADDVPATNPSCDAYDFGLQDTQGAIEAGREIGSRLAFDFTLAAKIRGTDHVVFAGRFASGPADDRFVYLSWWSVPRRTWINRVKARLSSIDATTIRTLEPDDVLVADMTGREPGGGREPVAWHREQIGHQNFRPVGA